MSSKLSVVHCKPIQIHENKDNLEVVNQSPLDKYQNQNWEQQQFQLENSLHTKRQAAAPSWLYNYCAAKQNYSKFDEINQKTIDENRKDVQKKISSCLQNVQIPLASQLTNHQQNIYTSQYAETTGFLNNPDNDYPVNLSSLHNQLKCTCRNIDDAHNRNKSLKQEIFQLQRQYEELEQNVIQRKVDEANTIKSLCMKQVMEDDKASNLLKFAKKLSKTRLKIENCNECRKQLPGDVNDTVEDIKRLMDLIRKKNVRQNELTPMTSSLLTSIDQQNLIPATESSMTHIDSTVNFNMHSGPDGISIDTETEVRDSQPKIASTDIKKDNRLVEPQTQVSVKKSMLSKTTSEKLVQTDENCENEKEESQKDNEDHLKNEAKTNDLITAKEVPTGVSKSSALKSIEKTLSNQTFSFQTKLEVPSSLLFNSYSEDFSPEDSILLVEDTNVLKNLGNSPAKRETFQIATQSFQKQASMKELSENFKEINQMEKETQTRKEEDIEDEEETQTREEEDTIEKEGEMQEEEEEKHMEEEETYKRVFDLAKKTSEDFNIKATITKSGNLEVISEGPHAIIESLVTYTKSGNVHATTEVFKNPNGNFHTSSLTKIDSNEETEINKQKITEEKKETEMEILQELLKTVSEDFSIIATIKQSEDSLDVIAKSPYSIIQSFVKNAESGNIKSTPKDMKYNDTYLTSSSKNEIAEDEEIRKNNEDEEDAQKERELRLDLSRKTSEDFNIKAKITKSGNLGVVTESPHTTIESVVRYTKSGNVNATTEVIKNSTSSLINENIEDVEMREEKEETEEKEEAHDLSNKSSENIKIKATITKSGNLDVVTESPHTVIESIVRYTKSGYVNVTTEVFKNSNTNFNLSSSESETEVLRTSYSDTSVKLPVSKFDTASISSINKQSPIEIQEEKEESINAREIKSSAKIGTWKEIEEPQMKIESVGIIESMFKTAPVEETKTKDHEFQMMEAGDTTPEGISKLKEPKDTEAKISESYRDTRSVGEFIQESLLLEMKADDLPSKIQFECMEVEYSSSGTKAIKRKALENGNTPSSENLRSVENLQLVKQIQSSTSEQSIHNSLEIIQDTLLFSDITTSVQAGDGSAISCEDLLNERETLRSLQESILNEESVEKHQFIDENRRECVKEVLDETNKTIMRSLLLANESVNTALETTNKDANPTVEETVSSINTEEVLTQSSSIRSLPRDDYSKQSVLEEHQNDEEADVTIKQHKAAKGNEETIHETPPRKETSLGSAYWGPILKEEKLSDIPRKVVLGAKVRGYTCNDVCARLCTQRKDLLNEQKQVVSSGSSGSDQISEKHSNAEKSKEYAEDTVKTLQAKSFNTDQSEKADLVMQADMKSLPALDTNMQEAYPSEIEQNVEQQTFLFSAAPVLEEVTRIFVDNAEEILKGIKNAVTHSQIRVDDTPTIKPEEFCHIEQIKSSKGLERLRTPRRSGENIIADLLHARKSRQSLELPKRKHFTPVTTTQNKPGYHEETKKNYEYVPKRKGSTSLTTTEDKHASHQKKKKELAYVLQSSLTPNEYACRQDKKKNLEYVPKRKNSTPLTNPENKLGYQEELKKLTELLVAKTQCPQGRRPRSADYHQVNRRRRSKSSSDRKADDRSSRRSPRMASSKVPNAISATAKVSESTEGKSKSLQQVRSRTNKKLIRRDHAAHEHVVKSKLAEIKCDSKECECGICSAEKKKEKPAESDNFNCLSGCTCLLCSSSSLAHVNVSKQVKQAGDATNKEVKQEKVAYDELTKREEHPPSCQCLECVVHPRVSTKFFSNAEFWHPEQCECLFCKCCSASSISNAKLKEFQQCLFEQVCIKGIPPSTNISNSQPPLSKKISIVQILESSTDTNVMSDLATPLTLSISNKISIETISYPTVSQDVEVICLDDSSTHLPNYDGSETTASINNTASKKIENEKSSHEERIVEMQDADFARQKQEMVKLQEEIKQAGNACQIAENSVLQSSPLEQSFVAIHKSSFHVTMSGLKVALCGLQNKFLEKDRVIANITNKLTLKSSGVLDDMLNKDCNKIIRKSHFSRTVKIPNDDTLNIEHSSPGLSKCHKENKSPVSVHRIQERPTKNKKEHKECESVKTPKESKVCKDAEHFENPQEESKDPPKEKKESYLNKSDYIEFLKFCKELKDIKKCTDHSDHMKCSERKDTKSQTKSKRNASPPVIKYLDSKRIKEALVHPNELLTTSKTIHNFLNKTKNPSKSTVINASPQSTQLKIIQGGIKCPKKPNSDLKNIKDPKFTRLDQLTQQLLTRNGRRKDHIGIYTSDILNPQHYQTPGRPKSMHKRLQSAKEQDQINTSKKPHPAKNNKSFSNNKKMNSFDKQVIRNRLTARRLRDKQYSKAPIQNPSEEHFPGSQRLVYVMYV